MRRPALTIPGRTPLWTHPGIIVAAALAARLLWLALVPAIPVSDGVLYAAFAKSIVAGRGYAFPDGSLTVYWPVGTSAVYAALYSVFGDGPYVVPVFQAFVGAATVALTWRLAHDAFGREVAGLAAWSTAAWPLLIEFTTVHASEPLFMLLILAAINVWRWQRLPFAVRMTAWGALIAAATYVRPTAWPLLFIFPIIQWVFDRNGRSLVAGTLIACATAAILFAPWTYRNEAVFGRFVLVSANKGVNLWMGNNPASDGGYMELPERKFPSEVDRDRHYGQEAVAFIKTHPIAYARLCMNRLITTYSRETIGLVWNQAGLSDAFGPGSLGILKLASSAYWWLFLVLGCWGIVGIVVRGPYERAWPLLVTSAFLAVIPILTVSMDRYHVPLDPLLAIFAAHGMVVGLRYARPA